MIIVDDLDKLARGQQSEDFFYKNYQLLIEPSCFVVYTFPIPLAFHPQYENVRHAFNGDVILLQMPVRKRNGEPHKEGRKFYSDVISRRIEPDLLEENVLDYAIESTGKLSELVEVMKEASLSAFRKGQKRISKNDVAVALEKLRMTFDRTLTEAHKKKLLEINRCKEAREEGPDSVLTRELLFSLTAVEYEDEDGKMVRDKSHAASSGGEMEPISLEDLDEVDLLLTELEISQGKGNLILCIVASPAYRERVIEVIKKRFPARILPVETGDNLISDLRSIQPKEEEILIWTLPETLGKDILDALNNFRELFYDAGVPSLIFMTPAELDDVIWKAPDFWRYRGGYHILKGEDHGPAYQAVEALSIPFSFSYQNKEELLRRKRINEYLLEKMQKKSEKENILMELGTIHFLLSEPRKAIEYYEQALASPARSGTGGAKEMHWATWATPTPIWAMPERPSSTTSRRWP